MCNTLEAICMLLSIASTRVIFFFLLLHLLQKIEIYILLQSKANSLGNVLSILKLAIQVDCAFEVQVPFVSVVLLALLHPIFQRIVHAIPFGPQQKALYLPLN